jgi:hypothetical protein
VRFEWDDHDWSESACSHRPKEQRMNPSTVHRDGNLVTGESETGCDSHGGNPGDHAEEDVIAVSPGE